MNTKGHPPIAAEPELLGATLDITFGLLQIETGTAANPDLATVSAVINRPEVPGLLPYALCWWVHHAATFLPEGEQIVLPLSVRDPDLDDVVALYRVIREQAGSRTPISRQTRAVARALRPLSDNAKAKAVLATLTVLTIALKPFDRNVMHLAIAARLVHRASSRHSAPDFLASSLVKIALRSKAKDEEFDRNGWDILLLAAKTTRGWTQQTALALAVRVMADVLVIAYEQGAEILGSGIVKPHGTPEAMVSWADVDLTRPVTNIEVADAGDHAAMAQEMERFTALAWQLTDSLIRGDSARASELFHLATTAKECAALLSRQSIMLNEVLPKLAPSSPAGNDQPSMPDKDLLIDPVEKGLEAVRYILPLLTPAGTDADIEAEWRHITGVVDARDLSPMLAIILTWWANQISAYGANSALPAEDSRRPGGREATALASALFTAIREGMSFEDQSVLAATALQSMRMPALVESIRTLGRYLVSVLARHGATGRDLVVVMTTIRQVWPSGDPAVVVDAVIESIVNADGTVEFRQRRWEALIKAVQQGRGLTVQGAMALAIEMLIDVLLRTAAAGYRPLDPAPVEKEDGTFEHVHLDDLDPTPPADRPDRPSTFVGWATGLSWRLLEASKRGDHEARRLLLEPVSSPHDQVALLLVLSRWARQGICFIQLPDDDLQG